MWFLWFPSDHLLGYNVFEIGYFNVPLLVLNSLDECYYVLEICGSEIV